MEMEYLSQMFTTEAFIIAGVLGVILLAVGGIIALAYQSAQSQGGYLFTYVKEGTAKAIMRGKTFHRFVWASEEYFLNVPGSDFYVEEKTDWEVLSRKDYRRQFNIHRRQRPWLERRFGIYWVGIPPFYKVHTYKFEWIEEKEDDQGNRVPWHRDDPTDFIFLKKFPYYTPLKEAEDKNKLPLNLWYLLTTRTTNPYCSLFKTEDWLKQVTAAANRAARNFVGRSTFADLTSEYVRGSEPKDDSIEPFSKPITDLNDLLVGEPTGENDKKEGLMARFGQMVVSADLIEVELPPGTSERLRAATTAKYVAEEEAHAKRAEAEGEADAVRTMAEGRAQEVRTIGRAEVYRIQKVYGALGALGDLGRFVRQLEAMEAPGEGEKIIWANNPLMEGKPDLVATLENLGISRSELISIARERLSE